MFVCVGKKIIKRKVHFINIKYEGGSINYVTNALTIKTTSAIFMNDASFKRSNSCGYSDILHNGNNPFVRRANLTTMVISYRHWPYFLLKLIKCSYGLN